MADPPILGFSRPPALASMIPPYFSIGSLLYVLSYKFVKSCFARSSQAGNEGDMTARSLKDMIKAYDGLQIIGFRVVKLACCTALFFLQGQKPFDRYNVGVDVSMIFLYVGDIL